VKQNIQEAIEFHLEGMQEDGLPTKNVILTKDFHSKTHEL